ncbi:MAG: GNAT family N-acetyltransferase, partial [Dehalococcoidia bacterium]|nr:GNAT family N-acetyltransferase [Dehalococcoidia bacterium]
MAAVDTGAARPFHLWRDLWAVADLIDRAFGPDGADERLSRRDIVALQAMAPFLALVGLVAPPVRDAFAGVVWIEHGRIVGNATISRLRGDRLRWLIGNVAVAPERQGCGIGQRVMREALAMIRARGGRVAVLDVRADNTPAVLLYRRLGFQVIDETRELLLPTPTRPVATDSPTPRALGAADWQAIRAALRAATPPDVAAMTPVTDPHAFAMAVTAGFGRAGRLVAGLATTLLATEDSRGLTGLVEVEVRERPSPHRLRLTITPRGRGVVERALIAHGTALLVGAGRRVRAEVRATEHAAL